LKVQRFGEAQVFAARGEYWNFGAMEKVPKVARYGFRVTSKKMK
jgi:hypothetical protein